MANGGNLNHLKSMLHFFWFNFFWFSDVFWGYSRKPWLEIHWYLVFIILRKLATWKQNKNLYSKDWVILLQYWTFPPENLRQLITGHFKRREQFGFLLYMTFQYSQLCLLLAVRLVPLEGDERVIVLQNRLHRPKICKKNPSKPLLQYQTMFIRFKNV